VVGIDFVMIGAVVVVRVRVIVIRVILVRVIVIRVWMIMIVIRYPVVLLGVIVRCGFVVRRVELRRVCPRVMIRIFDNGALHAFAVIAPTRVAVPRTAAAGAIF
jgi:hypothetical protein